MGLLHSHFAWSSSRCFPKKVLGLAIRLFHSTYFHLAVYPFIGDFDLPKRICLNGFFLFFFDKVRHLTSQNKVFFALSEASRCVNFYIRCPFKWTFRVIGLKELVGLSPRKIKSYVTFNSEVHLSLNWKFVLLE
jgi:hypothetical protein